MQGQVAKYPHDFSGLLTEAEKPVVEVINARDDADIIFVCEHASNTIPLCFDGLGLSQEQNDSHIAWDIGARDVAIALSNAFNAPLVSSRISRLVYDCNRPSNSPTAIPRQSENTTIPGNQAISARELQARTEQIYQPFYECLREVIKPVVAKGFLPALITIHSFTPVFFGKMRATEIGILHSDDTRLADAMLSFAPQTTSLRVERNQPYGPKDGVAHTLDVHGKNNDLPNVMIEIKNDLLLTSDAVSEMVSALKSMIKLSLSSLEIRSREETRHA